MVPHAAAGPAVRAFTPPRCDTVPCRRLWRRKSCPVGGAGLAPSSCPSEISPRRSTLRDQPSERPSCWASPTRRLSAPGGAPWAGRPPPVLSVPPILGAPCASQPISSALCASHPWCSRCQPSLVLHVPAKPSLVLSVPATLGAPGIGAPHASQAAPGAPCADHSRRSPWVHPVRFAAGRAAPGSHRDSGDIRDTSGGDGVTAPGAPQGLVSVQAPSPRGPTAGRWQGKHGGAGTMTSCGQSDGRAGKESVTTEPSTPSLPSGSPGAARVSAHSQAKVGSAVTPVRSSAGRDPVRVSLTRGSPDRNSPTNKNKNLFFFKKKTQTSRTLYLV